MEELSRSRRGLRLPDLARRLGFPKSSTHSLLVALERRGYVQRNDRTGRYLFGSRILALANAALSGMTLRDVAYPLLVGVMRSTGLACKIAVLERNQAVLIEQVHPPHILAPTTWLGKHMDLHCTGLGKALASFQLHDQWNRIATEHKLARHNESTICSPTRLLKELSLTRERGYAYDNEEFDIGMRCLAVPVFGAGDEPAAAIGVTGTTLEIHDGNIDAIVTSLKAAAAKAGAGLRTLTETIADKESDGDQRFSSPPTPLHRSPASMSGNGLDSFGFRG